LGPKQIDIPKYAQTGMPQVSVTPVQPSLPGTTALEQRVAQLEAAVGQLTAFITAAHWGWSLRASA